ncbi:NAD(P)/FAD-dependent oxidoreductase [Arthrobacter sp. KNU-44]|uniref:NAD(P)/FAD-dependent oxidoreductase n=1 Tax=Arthrobacter sp. KNU-44 TaxID=3450744 RepID=UPI003F424726
MSRTFDTLIVGAGHGGAQLALSLAGAGYAGSVAVISNEPYEPYERPPLSKGFLTGQTAAGDLDLRSRGYWESTGIEFILNTEVVRVDAAERRVWTAGGESIGYARLVWAAGGNARRLPVPGGDLEGVYTLRTRSDAERLKAELAAGARNAVIIGGGYIGLESAAALVAAGLSVTVVESMDRLLARVTGPAVSEYFAGLHQRSGVEVLLGQGVVELAGTNGRVNAVQLASGREIPADVVVVGVGLVPNTGVLEGAGAEAGNGIIVDEYCRTRLPGVYAIGDCANFPSARTGGRLRLESVQNAVDQAKLVAAEIATGAPAPYDALPWFWSHQYGTRLQTAGLLTGYDDCVVRGDPGTGKFSAVYLQGRTVLAIDAVNTVRDFAQGKVLVGAEYAGTREELADPARPLKDVVLAGAKT